MRQSIASEARYRQRVVKYSLKNGVSKAADRFHCSRQVIYNWRDRYDGKS
ncbi:MAG: helix-turn-helix domain-containing protein, partial [Clostridia bacterium]|nr:helix-turn-helix domain-containing protein [Clostridia bacterium]